MGTSNSLPNVRTTSDLTIKVRLKDGGLAIDWTGLTDIKAWIYSDVQKAIAGRCTVSIDQADSTLLLCDYSAFKPQYLGVNRIIVQCKNEGRTKTYDTPALNFVPFSTMDSRETPLSNPDDIEAHIEVQDVSSSILDEVIIAALNATERANDAAAAAEHMTDIHQGPPGPAGKAPYIDETTGNWFVWDDDEDAYVDSEIHAQGVAGNGIASWSVVESDQDGGSNVVTVTFTDGNSEIFTYKNGHTGATPQITIGTVETGAAGSEAEASMTGTPENPVLNLTIPRGDPGVVQAKYIEVQNLPAASASTMNALYLVPSELGTPNVYDVYYTTEVGRETYSWIKLCTTEINLSNYATKDELTQLEAEVHQLAGKFYGVFADDSDLPDDADAVGYAFVGATNPYAVWNFDGTNWSDSGTEVTGITGEPGVGFQSIFTPSPYDGTMIIVLTDGNTITVDLNHNHGGYYSKVLGGAQPAGGFLPDVVYSLGSLSGTITFSLASPVTGNVNHYFWMFDTGVSAPTITWPAGLTWAAGSAPTISASKHYEISILGGVAYYSEM